MRISNDTVAVSAMFIFLVAMASLAVLLSNPACSLVRTEDRQEKAAKTLLSAKETIISVATAADAACKKGLLKEDACTEIARLYQDAQDVYDVAADALVLAVQTQSPAMEQHYLLLQEDFFNLYKSVIEFAISSKLLDGK